MIKGEVLVNFRQINRTNIALPGYLGQILSLFQTNKWLNTLFDNISISLSQNVTDIVRYVVNSMVVHKLHNIQLLLIHSSS